MKRGVGHSESNSSGQPGKRRSTRGAALLAAAGSPTSSASVETSAAANRTSRRTTSTTNGAASLPGAAGTVKHQGSRAAASSENRSSPRRNKKARDAAAVAPQQLGAVSSTATPRGTTGVRKRAASAPSPAAAAAAAGVTRSSSSAASTTSKRGRIGGGRGKGKSADAVVGDDRDAAKKMLASLLSPVAAAREDSRSETQEPQGREGGESTAAGESAGGGDGGGAEVEPHSCPLESMFLALEQVLPLFRRRRQATLLKQVRPAVEGMCGRSFTRQHLAQIVYVQPDAYKLSSKTDARPTRGGYRLRDLLIEIGPNPGAGGEQVELNGAPNQGRGERGGVAGEGDRGASLSSGTRDGHSSSGSVGIGRSGGGGGGGAGGGAARGEGEAVSARRREVFRRLLASARAKHCKCGRPSTEESANARDGECSCLPEATLPETAPLSVDGSSRGSGGGSSGSGIGSESPSSSDAQGQGSRPFGRSCGGIVAAAGLAGREDYDAEGSDAPKNVEALRERLRLKDAQGALERNKTVEEKEADRRRKGNLPVMADAVRSYFAHSGRTTCSLDALVEALSSSSKHALSRKEVRDRVRMLADLVPEWCTIIAPPRPPASGGGGGDGGGGGGAGSRDVLGGVDSGMVARPMKAKEVVRLNTRIRFDEVRQMIVFMAGGGGGASQ